MRIRGYIAVMALVMLVAGCPATLGAAEPLYLYKDPVIADNTVSLRRNAAVSIGGQVWTDAVHRRAGGGDGPHRKTTDIMISMARLRLHADIHPGIKAIFKVNFNGDRESRPRRSYHDDNEILEEAILIMGLAGAPGLEFMVGKGTAPYGQDISMGLVQSYHHSANRPGSAEGDIFLAEPFHRPENIGSERSRSPLRPGRMDRVFTAGVAYQWDERLRVEVAVFQPERSMYFNRLRETAQNEGHDLGGAVRMWWRPLEDVTFQASAMAIHSSDMGRTGVRTDLYDGEHAVGTGYAASFGVDWRMGSWRAFGEVEQGWDWGSIAGYRTTTWQAGAAKQWGEWQVGSMVENLRISRPGEEGTRERYRKWTVSLRYTFCNGLHLIAEYGREWARRKNRIHKERRWGELLGLRLAFNF